MKAHFRWIGITTLAIGSLVFGVFISHRAQHENDKTRTIAGLLPASTPAAGVQNLAQNQANHWVDELKSGHLSVARLVNGLDSKQPVERRLAAQAIIELRDHYIDVSYQVAQASAKAANAPNANKIREIKLGVTGPGEQHWDALWTLAHLRPSSPAIIEAAQQDITFQWMPMIRLGWEHEVRFASATLLVSSSLAALPQLAQQMAQTDLTGQPETIDFYRNHASLSALCAYSFLETSAPQWLEQEAKDTNDADSKARLQQAARFVGQVASDNPNKPSDAINRLRFFGSRVGIQLESSDEDLKPLRPERYPIKWNVIGYTPDKKPFVKEKDIEQSMALLKYAITQRLTLLNKERDSKYKAFRAEACSNAVSVLGALRTIDRRSQWVMWQHLQKLALHKPIPGNNDAQVTNCIRAFQQIDVPAANEMILLISWDETSPPQKETAAYVLGRIMGRYSVPMLQAEIDWYKANARGSHDKGERAEYQGLINQLEHALQIGKDKKWFEGDYYGKNDPHAYDLILADEQGAMQTT